MDAAGVQERLPPPQGGKAPRRDSEYLRCRFEAIEGPQTFSGPGVRSAETQDLTQAEWPTCAERRRFPRMTSELVLAVTGRINPKFPGPLWIDCTFNQQREPGRARKSTSIWNTPAFRRCPGWRAAACNLLRSKRLSERHECCTIHRRGGVPILCPTCVRHDAQPRTNTRDLADARFRPG